MTRFFTLLLLFSTTNTFSQAPLVRQWDYRYGGLGAEELNTAIITSDSGFILGGYTDSDSSGDVTQHTQGNTDFWVVKTNASGLKQWDKRFGGLDGDRLNSIVQTTDGGYILGGYTESDSTGDMSQHTQGYADYWVIKIDATGLKQWDRRFGGTFNDYMKDIVQTQDGGYLFAGTTFSDSTGDLTHFNNGGSDFWIVKTDSSGNKLWDKVYGGFDDETLFSVAIAPDGSFILTGSSLSDSTGNVVQHSRGGMDYWVVKTDSAGVVLWSKLYGGTQNDFGVYSIITYGGDVLTGGFSFSDSTGDVSQHTKGLSDYWLVKTSANGVKQWNKRYGGDLNEQVFCNISKTLDGKYLISGLSYSYMSGDKSEDNLGTEQPWYLKIDTNGTRLWDKTVFTTGHEEAGFTFQTDDSCIVTALFTPAGIGGYKTEPSQGFYDFWFVKLCDSVFVNTQFPYSDLQSSLVVYPNPVANYLHLKAQLQQIGPAAVSIYDIAGKRMWANQFQITNKNFETIIDVSALSNGIYFLHLKTLDSVRQIKFIIDMK